MNQHSSISGEETVYQLRRIGSPATLGGVADVFKLRQDVTRIGRAKEKVEFFIDSSKNKALISRIHARIFKSRTLSGKDLFKICDTSLNGTFVNDVKILNEAPLRPGDTVVFGHLQGAALQAGNCYSQFDSEFRFKFESSQEVQLSSKKSIEFSDADFVENSEVETTDCPSEDHNRTLQVPNFPDLSVFLETPTPPPSSQGSRQSTSSTKRELVKKFDESDSETDYKLLQEYASAATVAATRQSDSDEDLFSIKYTNILPGGVTDILMAGDEKCKSPERKRQKRKLNLKSRKTCQSSKKPSSAHQDCCSANECLKPCEKLISWVQCDDCDQWFHIKCAGISLKLVKPKNAKFHCGCR